MLGAIAGDIIGSVRENLRTKRKDFRLFTPLSIFTDDTVLTVVVADAILNQQDYGPDRAKTPPRFHFRLSGLLVWEFAGKRRSRRGALESCGC